MVTQLEHDEAVERGNEALRTQPRAISARYDAASHRIVVELNTGYSVSFPPERAQGFESANSESLSEVEISFPGFGIHFPKLNADLWVPALARGIFGSKRWETAWLAAHPLEELPFRVSEAPSEGRQNEAQTAA
ncbi:DUF2442 domain-containing protein [Granulicella tundricola]|uniref:DUF2442 domain-containing protein n=1 Tax=Granulicella tundricola (strain ATCC BAA-1859 / DSM 23138 / MP5ACTX9) TaxID=1198114 RepID=E8WYN1_GRATM|nr:DUF2442 domain-containing protein [Granulicella tundricola]ADW67629.1 hypothetical protein AciX9_0557 [Granulicella tundricola MP5ACTX9]